MITGYFITAEQYFNKNRKAYEEMKVFLYAFRLLSKVKAAIITTRTWYLSSNMPTRKYEKIDRANEIYKSELRLPIIPTCTERSINLGPKSQNGRQIQHGRQKSCDTSKFTARDPES